MTQAASTCRRSPTKRWAPRRRNMGCMAGRTGISWGPTAGAASVVRHTGMFAVTSKMYPLTFFKEMYDLDEAAKRECGFGTPSIRRSMTVTLPATWQSKKNISFSIIPTTTKTSASCANGWAWCSNSATSGAWSGRRRRLSTKGPVPYQRLGNLYDVVKEIKQLVDPNNILNPGALY